MKLFRKARRSEFGDGLVHYLGYAAGEIVLIVIGILLALQIDTWNNARQDRSRELGYLANIRGDMVANVNDMDRYLADRKGRIAAAERILAHFEGKPITDPSAFNADSINIYSWQRYYLGNNTYQELVSSGNFALLSNPDIKRQLLEIEALYGKMKGEEDHYRFDSETALYRPLYELADTRPMVEDMDYQSSGGKSGLANAVDAATFTPVLHSRTMKNGFEMTIIEYQTMNAQMEDLRSRCRQLIAEIDKELKRG